MGSISRRDVLAWLGLISGLSSHPARALWASPAAGSVELPPAHPRDLPARDRRLEIRTLDTPRLPPKFASRAEWEARATRLREQILSAAGLWPMPERTPLRAQVFDRIEEERSSVEKVYFESYPRFYCTGSLYRPRGDAHQAPFPGILCPHGHWNYGRLENNPDDENGCSIPQRCMNFALQGYVAFAYDMVGYNDSFQVPHRLAQDDKAAWGLTPEAVLLGLWGVGQLGLQLWNSIRAFDFLASLPDVDAERLAATGASGGGTQTFLLTAVDERVKASAPVNMISHFMQGGCVCENAPNLRIDTDNMEFGALAAPRPLLMVSATGDWTRDSDRIEYPAIKAIYERLGVPERVAHEQFPFQHNYNRPSREAVYTFFTRWLKKEPLKSDSQRVTEQGEFHIDPGRLLVFSRRQPPAEALNAEELMQALVANARGQLEAAEPRSLDELEAYRKQFWPVFRTALMAEAPAGNDLRWWTIPQPGSRGSRQHLILSRASVGDRIPAQLVQPRGRIRRAALIVHAQGANAALGAADDPSPLARELSKRNYLLLSIDAFQTGEARDPNRKMEGGFFSTYNRTDDMQRVQDILTAAAYLEAAWQPQSIAIVGQGMAGLWCLLARPFLTKPCAVVADAAGFESGKDEAYLGELHIPLLRRAGDFQTAALLAPPAPLLLHNLSGQFPTDAFKSAYSLQGVAARLRFSNAELSAAEIARWLLLS